MVWKKTGCARGYNIVLISKSIIILNLYHPFFFFIPADKSTLWVLFFEISLSNGSVYYKLQCLYV